MAEREPNRKDSRLKASPGLLDDLREGDIHGAFGTIRASDVTPRRTWRRRLLTLLAIVGPGLIVLVGDNDAGGVSTYALAGEYFGFKPAVVVPVAALILIGITVSGNFRRWERAMFVFLFASLLALPLLVVSHPSPAGALRGFAVPGIERGLTSNSALFIVAIVGTTVAPWQMFFQQSNVVDKRITPRWLDYEKADTVLGAFVVVIGAAAIIMSTASAFSGTAEFGHYVDGLHVSLGLHAHIGPLAGAIFALLLFDASIVGASAVTLATSYAFGDIFGVRQSLNRRIGEAKVFYGSY